MYVPARLELDIVDDIRRAMTPAGSVLIGFFRPVDPEMTRQTIGAFMAKTLTELAIQYWADKWGPHFYTPHYEAHLSKYRDQEFNLLEIGVGGWDDPTKGGASLRMWRDFFPKANIVGIDIQEKRLKEERIRTFQGDQSDPEFLRRVHEEAGPFRIIVDDGSHVSAHIIAAFEVLFPLLEVGGTYAVEDLSFSYLPKWGPSPNFNAGTSSLDLLKGLVDSLNYIDRAHLGERPSYADRNTVGLHFYHNLCIIDKAPNDEPSEAPFLGVPALPASTCERVAKCECNDELIEVVTAIGGPRAILELAKGVLSEALSGKQARVTLASRDAANVERISFDTLQSATGLADDVAEVYVELSVYDWVRFMAGRLPGTIRFTDQYRVIDPHGLLASLM